MFAAQGSWTGPADAAASGSQGGSRHCQGRGRGWRAPLGGHLSAGGGPQEVTRIYQDCLPMVTGARSPHAARGTGTGTGPPRGVIVPIRALVQGWASLCGGQAPACGHTGLPGGGTAPASWGESPAWTPGPSPEITNHSCSRSRWLGARGGRLRPPCRAAPWSCGRAAGPRPLRGSSSVFIGV